MNTIIEKIRAEVERLMKENSSSSGLEGGVLDLTYEDGINTALNDVLEILDTLQEQPVKTDIVEDLKHYLATTPKEQIEKDWESLKEWGKVGPSVSEFLGWEQPVCEGLEEEIERYQEEHFEYNSEFDSIRLKGDYMPSPQTFAYIARHFAQWQKEQMMKKTPVSEDLEEAAENYAYGESNDKYQGFVDGAKWDREQMLKDAVEGYISATNEVSAVLALPKGDFKKGDKVNLLFVKGD